MFGEVKEEKMSDKLVVDKLVPIKDKQGRVREWRQYVCEVEEYNLRKGLHPERRLLALLIAGKVRVFVEKKK